MPSTPRMDDAGAMEPVLASLPRAAGGRAQDEFDALADLFLGDDDPAATQTFPVAESPRPAKRHEPTRALIELLVQGHLPVRAAPWSSQYARLRATSLQAPAALVRLIGGHLSVELFGLEGPAIGPVDDAARAIDLAASAAALVIVQLDEVHQAAAAADPRLAAATVLAGANEAAVVATYRTLKGLAGVLAPATQGEEPPTDLQVALVANEDGAARDALERLRRAASVFLDRPLALAATVGKITQTGAVLVFRGESSIGPGRLMDMLAGGTAVGEATKETIEPPAESNATRGAGAPPPLLRSSESLARFIDGLRTLPVRLPDDAAVELAVDASGAMHLLRTDSDSRGVERLVAAAAWAVKHAALIAATGCGVDAGHAPVLHLFTGAPKAVRHLLDADVRVHVLARVGSEWYCAELN